MRDGNEPDSVQMITSIATPSTVTSQSRSSKPGRFEVPLGFCLAGPGSHPASIVE